MLGHECCGCYEERVPKDLRAVLDWVADMRRLKAELEEAEKMPWKRLTREQLVHYLTKGNPVPTPTEESK